MPRCWRSSSIPFEFCCPGVEHRETVQSFQLDGKDQLVGNARADDQDGTPGYVNFTARILLFQWSLMRRTSSP